MDQKLTAHTARRNRDGDRKRRRRPVPPVRQPKNREKDGGGWRPEFHKVSSYFEAGLEAGLDSGALVSVLDLPESESLFAADLYPSLR